MMRSAATVNEPLTERSSTTDTVPLMPLTDTCVGTAALPPASSSLLPCPPD